MSILVVGSIALDTVETPHGKVKDALGGSALYFSAVASLFNPVNMVGVVGADFNLQSIDFLKKRSVNLDGLEQMGGETFRWGGRYHEDINLRDTLFTELNVFQDFRPTIPEHYQNDAFIFLANIDPELQLEVLAQLKKPRLVVLDTMNFWISGKPEALNRLISKIDVLIVNNEEIQQLTGKANIFAGAEELLQRGPQAIVIKKGEHGAVLNDPNGYFLAPAFPVSRVVDPTGAGDSFAGGFLGYLSTCPEINHEQLRKAVVYGSVAASFTVEDFSLNRLERLSKSDIDERVENYRNMICF